MALIALTSAAAFGLAALSMTGADAPESLHMAQAQPFITTQGVVGPRGDYMTTAEGCTYRRTQAPGQPVRELARYGKWRLVMVGNEKGWVHGDYIRPV